jgi:hypothetical protein
MLAVLAEAAAAVGESSAIADSSICSVSTLDNDESVLTHSQPVLLALAPAPDVSLPSSAVGDDTGCAKCHLSRERQDREQRLTDDCSASLAGSDRHGELAGPSLRSFARLS